MLTIFLRALCMKAFPQAPCSLCGPKAAKLPIYAPLPLPPMTAWPSLSLQHPSADSSPTSLFNTKKIWDYIMQLRVMHINLYKLHDRHLLKLQPWDKLSTPVCHEQTARRSIWKLIYRMLNSYYYRKKLGKKDGEITCSTCTHLPNWDVVSCWLLYILRLHYKLV